MSRQAILATLFTLAISAPAVSAPPAATPQAHPSTSAHANAAAAQSNATHIEACTEATEAFLEHLTLGDYKAATGNFNAQMLAALAPAKLGNAWQAIAIQYGKLESRGTAQNVMYQGLAVVTVPLRFEKGTLGARLACGADGKFSGFHIVSVPPAAPAASG